KLHQGSVIAVIAAGIVIAGAQQAAIVGRLIGPVAATLADKERVRKDRGKTVERLLVLGLLAGRIDQIGIAGAGIGLQRRPAGRSVFMQRRIFRDFRQGRFRLIVGAEVLRIALAVIVGILLQAVIVDRLGLARQARHLDRIELHRGVGADASDEVAHLDRLRGDLIGA